MIVRPPRLVVSALAGDGGKTLVAIGVIRALARRGLSVAPFKKGPDYIDPAWLGAAAGQPARNLDTFLMRPEAIGRALERAANADLIVVEGNRGLHDGADALGTHSTAELARRLQAAVVIVADATKATRTLAACVLGCAALEPRPAIAGVILNRVGTVRQERVVREAFVATGAPPVLGAIPRVAPDPLPARHLGLVTAAEDGHREATIERAADLAAAHVDLDALLRGACGGPVSFPDQAVAGAPAGRARIGVLRDEALSFYYEDNLDALADAGAELVTISPLRSAVLPDLDAIYIGGGFPEIYAAGLQANVTLRRAIAAAARAGMPIYAECGGLMYLARELRVGSASYEMCGVIDAAVEHTDRPQGHGYVEARVDRANPFFPVGTRLRGHEFHYSRVVDLHAPSALQIERGAGLGNGRDALVTERVWASYLHLHALGTPAWAPGLVGAALAARGAAVGGVMAQLGKGA
jgi:cobyrinic acid a,c-diamide synthase